MTESNQEPQAAAAAAEEPATKEGEEITLESLNERVTALEQKAAQIEAAIQNINYWRR